MQENTSSPTNGVSFRRALFDVSVAFGSFAVAIGLVAVMGLFPTSTANAYVAPRPTVELVKMFSGPAAYSRYAQDLEQEANDWLRDNQPGIRIVDRQLTTSQHYITLAIFYEVLESRTTKGKSPAEATP